MNRIWLLTLCIAMTCAACGDDGGNTDTSTVKDDTPPIVDGKSDSALLIEERGALRGTAATVAGDLGEGAQAYRFNAWGDTTVRVSFSSPGILFDPYLVIDGPYPGAGGEVVVYNDDDGSRDTLDSAIEVTLEEPGAYRIVVGSYEHFKGGEPGAGAFELDFACLENCEMRQITLTEMLGALNAEVGQEQVQGVIAAALPALFPDTDTANAVSAQINGVFSGDVEISGVPRVPLAAASTAQGLFERPDSETIPPEPVTFDLNELLTANCTPDRPANNPVHPMLPGLSSGSYADYALDDCNLQRAQDFATVLNNLSLDNGSSVVNGETSYESVQSVFEALIASDHHVVVTNQRFFADFLGLYYNGAAVVAPVWLETQIMLSDGSLLAIPSPHTHHTITVEGPLVNAKLMYYMGVSNGVSFRAVGNVRSPWTGERTLYTYDSNTDPDTVVELMVTAGELRKKWAAEGAGLQAEGYGTLGVCNDSTAILEYTAENSVSIFPLAHPVIETAEDDIDAALQALPADLFEFDAMDAVGRIKTTMPFEGQSADFPQLSEALDSL